jgi:uncharacterized protein
MEQIAIPPSPPPPEKPELPDGLAPRWPPWYAAVGFAVALIGTLIAVGIVAAATGATSDDESPTFTIVATLMQSVIFIGTAVLFASFTRKPELWHFGLRRTRLWPAVGWAALGLVSFYVFAAIYTWAVNPDVEQTVAEDLGADQGSFGLIAAGFMIVCVAPVAEEFFFRGYFFGALRNWRGLWPAAVITGLVFGGIHVGSAPVGFLVPLAFFGFLLCLIYDRTRSLYPCMALHCLNNSIAFGIGEHWDWQIPLVLAASLTVIAGAMLTVRRSWP